MFLGFYFFISFGLSFGITMMLIVSILDINVKGCTVVIILLLKCRLNHDINTKSKLRSKNVLSLKHLHLMTLISTSER